jgi:hypothetical protein
MTLVLCTCGGSGSDIGESSDALVVYVENRWCHCLYHNSLPIYACGVHGESPQD